MKTAILLSIREKSKRFPKKVLKELYGQTVTEHLIDRLKLAEGIDRIIIATSDDPRDRVFEQIATKKNVNIYYGSQEDKLFRYLQICDHFHLDAVIIVDGDDILCFPEIMTETAQKLKSRKFDVIFWKNLPVGARCSGLTKKALEKVMSLKDESDTEVWGGYFTKGHFKVSLNQPREKLFIHPEVRMTLDYPEDFDFFKAVFDELYEKNKAFTSSDLMKLLIYEKPEITRINQEAQKKYENHLLLSAPVKFKKQ